MIWRWRPPGITIVPAHIIFQSLNITTANINNQNSPAFKQCDVKFVPIFLGGLMNACGNTPPIAIKSIPASTRQPSNRLTTP